MARISLKCEQCGGRVILDESREIGTCEYCLSRFIVKEDKIIQNITQNITKHVYGVEGKTAEELLSDANYLLRLGENRQANTKFKQVLKVDPSCWGAWLGYASTGGDGCNYSSVASAYTNAYNIAATEKQEMDTFTNMTGYIDDRDLRDVFIRTFGLATGKYRSRVFELVAGVIGCDESEIAALAIDLCPGDWRTHFAMARIRQIRVRWCKTEGNFFTGWQFPPHVIEVQNYFLQAYRLARREGEFAVRVVLNYIDALSRDNSYATFATALKAAISRER